MYYPNGRGHSSAADARARSTEGGHPNWGHPDHDACGTGFIARLGGAPSYDIIQFALTALERLTRSEEHTSELQSQSNLVCRLLLEKKKQAREAVPQVRAEGGRRVRAARE